MVMLMMMVSLMVMFFNVVGKVHAYVMLVDDSIVHTRTREHKALPIIVERHLVGDDVLTHDGGSAVDEVNLVAKVMSRCLGISPAAGRSLWAKWQSTGQSGQGLGNFFCTSFTPPFTVHM